MSRGPWERAVDKRFGEDDGVSGRCDLNKYFSLIITPFAGDGGAESG